MRCFSNIMPNFALILHLLVDSIPSHAVKKFMRENLHTGAGLKDEEYYGR